MMMMMNDEWWMMNDEWWRMNDEWWMMNDDDDRNPLPGRVQHLSEALSPPYWAKLDSWRRVDSGTWSLGWKKTYVIYCKKPCGSAAVASKLGILGIPRGSIEDVLQRLRAIFGGLQSAHVGMAGLPDGLRFGQGWARCPTSRLGVGEQLIDGLVGGLEHEFYDGIYLLMAI